jgi:hypothetical protein
MGVCLSDGNFWEGFGVCDGVELSAPRLPGAHERHFGVGVGFWFFAMFGGSPVVCEGETLP